MVLMAANRTWAWVFISLAGLAVAGSLIAYQAIFAMTPAGDVNRQTLAVLYSHDHAHFGVAMVVGFFIVAAGGFAIFRLLVVGKRDLLKNVTSGR
jgi:uncharacterized membrane protein YesL